MPPPLNPSQSQPSELRDRWLFFVAFVIGTLGTLAVKAFAAPTLVVILVPVLVIVTYAAAAWLPGDTSLEPDMIGDNCYYLGFILTLVSLGWTLYAVTRAPDDLDLVREIISGFGVALASTITGIFLRAFFMQLRPDVIAAERKARQAISRAARDLVTELSQSVAALKSFSVESQQALAEHHAKLEAASAEAQEAHRRWMKQYSKDTAKEASQLHRIASAQVRDASKETGTALVADMKTMLGSAQQEFQDWLRQADQRISGLCDRIDQQSQRLATSVNAVGASTKKASDQVEVAAGALATKVAGAAARFTKGTQGVTAGLADHADQLKQAAAASRQTLDREVQQLAAQLATASAQITSAAQTSAQDLKKSTDDATGSIAASAVQVSDKLTAALEQLSTSGEAIRSGTERLHGISERITHIARLLDESDARLQALRHLPTVSEAEASSEALAKSIAAIDKRIERFETAVVNATVLTKRVGEFSTQAKTAATELREAGTSLRAAAQALEGTLKASVHESHPPTQTKAQTASAHRSPFGMGGLFGRHNKDQG
jgi:hypothetical protein